MFLKTCRFCCFLLLGALLAGGQSSQADVIVNEFNAVSGSNQLSGSDSFFGTVDGNGGNWIELVVVGSGAGSTVDLRNWSVEWGEDEGGVIDGTYEADEIGVINFTNHSAWEAVASGTIITIIETDNGGLTATDMSFGGNTNGDWHINVCTLEEAASGDPLLLADSGANTAANDGEFSVGNSDFFVTLKDSSGSVVFGPLGENESNWAGGGIGGSEVGKLEGPADGSAASWMAVTAASNYDDGDNSTFGSANTWGSSVQDFSGLRTVPEPASAWVALVACGTIALRRRKLG